MDELARQLREQGARICLNAPAQRLGSRNGKPWLQVAGESRQYDRLICTTSPKLLLRLADDLADTAYGEEVAALKSIGGLCVVFALKRPLLQDGTYWLNLPADTPEKSQSAFPFLALVEHTNYLPREHYGGDHIIYCGDYVHPSHEYFQLEEEELVERFLPALAKINPAFTRDWLRKWWVWRAPYAQPVPQLHHSQRLPALHTPLPGVYWASMSQVYPWDRGTNYAVEIGRRAARLAMADAALI